VTFLNASLRSVFDVLLFPFRSLPPIVGLIAVSLATGVGMLLLFKATTDQARIGAVKRRIHACLFEIRLLADDPIAVLRAQGEILRHNASYLALALVPTALSIVLLAPALAQLQIRYGYEGLRPGQAFIVTARLKDAPPARPAARLLAPAGLAVETPAVWMPSQRELAWRLRAQKPGDYEVKVSIGEETLQKTVEVDHGLGRRSPLRPARTFAAQLLHPGEDPLPQASAVESIGVGYPAGSLPVFGWRFHWLTVFCVLSLLCVLGLRGRLRVTL
jgi:hypothetical protein